MKTVFTLIIILLGFSAFSQNQSKAGTLDSSFGTGGTADFRKFYIYTGCLQEDKILAGGNLLGGFGVRRFLHNGTVDESFGDKGIVAITSGGPANITYWFSKI